MRIVSLVPHATELLFALGLGDDVVAVTHECDFPREVRELPHVTRDVLPPGLGAADIDAAVRERTEQGKAIYELDERQLTELEPDLIVTQELCLVCAVSYDDVVKVAERIPSTPTVISLDPKTLGEAMGDIRTIAQATGARDAARDGEGVDFEIEDIVPFGVETGEPARLTGIFHPAGSELTIARTTRSEIDAFGIEYEGASAFSHAFHWAA